MEDEIITRFIADDSEYIQALRRHATYAKQMGAESISPLTKHIRRFNQQLDISKRKVLDAGRAYERGAISTRQFKNAVERELIVLSKHQGTMLDANRLLKRTASLINIVESASGRMEASYEQQRMALARLSKEYKTWRNTTQEAFTGLGRVSSTLIGPIREVAYLAENAGVNLRDMAMGAYAGSQSAQWLTVALTQNSKVMWKFVRQVGLAKIALQFFVEQLRFVALSRFGFWLLIITVVTKIRNLFRQIAEDMQKLSEEGSKFLRVSTEMGEALYETARGMNRYAQMMRELRLEHIRTGLKVEELSRIYYELGSAGLTAAEQLQALRPIADLLQAIHVDEEAPEVIKLIVDLYTAFGDKLKNVRGEQQKFAYLADAIAAIFAEHKIEVGALAESYKHLLSVVDMGNITFEESLAMLAVLADHMSRAGIAGRGLRMSLIEIIRELDKMNLNLDPEKPYQYFNAIMQLAEQYGEGFESLREAQRFFNTFNVRAGASLAILIENADELRKAFEQIADSEGKAAKMADVMRFSYEEIVKRYKELKREWWAGVGQMWKGFFRIPEITIMKYKMLGDAMKNHIDTATAVEAKHRLVTMRMSEMWDVMEKAGFGVKMRLAAMLGAWLSAEAEFVRDRRKFIEEYKKELKELEEAMKQEAEAEAESERRKKQLFLSIERLNSSIERLRLKQVELGKTMWQELPFDYLTDALRDMRVELEGIYELAEREGGFSMLDEKVLKNAEQLISSIKDLDEYLNKSVRRYGEYLYGVIKNLEEQEQNTQEIEQSVRRIVKWWQEGKMSVDDFEEAITRLAGEMYLMRAEEWAPTGLYPYQVQEQAYQRARALAETIRLYKYLTGDVVYALNRAFEELGITFGETETDLRYMGATMEEMLNEMHGNLKYVLPEDVKNLSEEWKLWGKVVHFVEGEWKSFLAFVKRDVEEVDDSWARMTAHMKDTSLLDSIARFVFKHEQFARAAERLLDVYRQLNEEMGARMQRAMEGLPEDLKKQVEWLLRAQQGMEEVQRRWEVWRNNWRSFRMQATAFPWGQRRFEEQARDLRRAQDAYYAIISAVMDEFRRRGFNWDAWWARFKISTNEAMEFMEQRFDEAGSRMEDSWSRRMERMF